MRDHGKLTRWNDDRGFGFISPAGGGKELFVHISAFPRDGRRPQEGEVLTYQTEAGPDGKPSAVGILRPGSSARAHAATTPAAAGKAGRQREPGSGGMLSKLLVLAAVVAIAGAVYTQFAHRPAPAAAPAPAVNSAAARATAAPASPYRCDGRTQCSQMHSCAEATFFVRNCPNTQMDGDGDGVPCERQWCN